MKKLLKFAIAIYLLASAAMSFRYNVSGEPWKVASERNGLLVAGVDANHIWVLSPFTNYEDVFLFGVGYDEDGLYVFSDGLMHAGEY